MKNDKVLERSHFDLKKKNLLSFLMSFLPELKSKL